MSDFCGIPLVSLRENSVTELDMSNKGIGLPGAIVLSKLLPGAEALTSLRCARCPSVLAFTSADRKANTLCAYRLDNNDLWLEGGAAIAEGLKSNTNLKWLS